MVTISARTPGISEIASRYMLSISKPLSSRVRRSVSSINIVPIKSGAA